MNSFREELAWLAGLYEGEGSFSFSSRSPHVDISMTDKDTIARVSNLLSVPMRSKRSLHKPIWHVRVGGDAALYLMHRLFPFLSKRRRERIAQIMATVARRPGLARGSRHHRAKLAEADVPAIFQLAAGGYSLANIAARYSVNRETIRAVLTRRTWKHVEIAS